MSVDKQSIRIVEYKCKEKNHTVKLTFGERPSWWPDNNKMPQFYHLRTTAFYDSAIEMLHTYCELCNRSVDTIRVGPQPE